MRERREAEPLATIRQCLARFVDRKQPFIVRLAFAEFFYERTQLRKDRDDETDIGLVAVNNDASGIQIDIAALDRRRFGLSESGQAEELDEIAALLSFALNLCARMSATIRVELLKGRSRPNRFCALRGTSNLWPDSPR